MMMCKRIHTLALLFLVSVSGLLFGYSVYNFIQPVLLDKTIHVVQQPRNSITKNTAHSFVSHPLTGDASLSLSDIHVGDIFRSNADGGVISVYQVIAIRELGANDQLIKTADANDVAMALDQSSVHIIAYDNVNRVASLLVKADKTYLLLIKKLKDNLII